MTIDEATHADIPQLCELLELLFGQEAEFQPDAAKQTAALGSLVGNPQRGRVFVLRHGTAVAGMASVQALVSTACGGDVLILEDLVVRPAYRNRGFGSALLDHIVWFARRGGYHRITLLTDRVNEAAQRLYARHGFSASDMAPYRLLLAQAPSLSPPASPAPSAPY
jgi:GNAT superfamily N-acetyltransferase